MLFRSGESEPLICRCDAKAGWRVGDQVALQFDDSNLHLFDADGLALKRHTDASQHVANDTTPHFVQTGTL